jgi:hypothetical protein
VASEGMRAWLLVRLGCDWRRTLTSAPRSRPSSMQPLADERWHELVEDWAARKPNAIKRVNRILTSAGLTMDAVLAQTLRENLDQIDCIAQHLPTIVLTPGPWSRTLSQLSPLDERLDRTHGLLVRVDIALASDWMSGLDAEGHDPALGRDRRGAPASGLRMT